MNARPGRGRVDAGPQAWPPYHARMKTPAILLLLASCAWFPTALNAAGCMPRITDAWLRMPPVAMPMLAGFARIENPCKAPVVVTGASSAAFEDVSLHETTLVDGISRMRAVAALTVPANGSVELKPGGLHLMLMQPAAMPKSGARVPVSVQLRDGRVLKAMFDVRAAVAANR